ncbi:hypothetical protein D3C80_954750 [compost metagenome]
MNRLGLTGQAVHRIADIVDRIGEFFDHLAGLHDPPRTAGRKLVNLARTLRGLLDMLRYLADGGGHFVHGRGCPVRFDPLHLQRGLRLVDQLAVVGGQVCGLVGVIAKATERGTNPRAFTDQGHLQARHGTGLTAVGHGHQFAVEGQRRRFLDFAQGTPHEPQ